MADIILDQGISLPPETDTTEVPEQQAKDYAVQLSIVERGTNAAQAIDKQFKIAQQGRALTQREVVKSNMAFEEGKSLLATTSARLGAVQDVASTLEEFRKADKIIKEEDFENKVIKQFNNTDSASNKILNERMDAMLVDDLRLSNELAFSNLNTEIQAEADGFWGDIQDLVESLGPAQIDEIINSPSDVGLLNELQNDMANLPTKEFRLKWKDKFKELQEDKFFDNPDRAIATFAMLNRGSLNDARATGALRIVEAATTIGAGTALKVGKLVGQRAILNRALSKTLESAPVKGTSVQINTIESLRSKLPEGLGKVSPISEAITNNIKRRSYTSDVAIRAGGSKFLAEDVARSLRDPNAISILNQEEQVGLALMGITPTETLNSVPSQIAKILSRGDRVLSKATDLAIDAASNVLTGKSLTARLEQEAASDFTGGTVINTSFTYSKIGEVTGIVAHVGAEGGTPFATKATATKWLKDNKLTGDVFESETGGFLANVSRSSEGISDEVISHAQNSGWFRSLLFQPADVIDADIQLLSRASEQSQTHVHNIIRDVWNKGIKPLKAKEKVELEEVLSSVQKRTPEEGGPVWLDKDEFVSEFIKIHGKAPKNRHLLGYFTVKQLEDTSYRLLNRSVYKSKLNQGMKTIDYKGNSSLMPESFTGKAVEASEVKAGEVIFNEATGEVRMFDSLVPARMTKTELDDLLKGNSLIRLEDSEDIGKFGVAQYVLAPKNALKVGELSPKQVGYVGGGRIKYDYNWIVHAKRSRKLDMFGGKEINLNPVGLFGGKTRKEVVEFAENLNKARLAALAESKGTMTIQEANSAIQRLALQKFQSVGEVKAFLRKRGVELQDEIVANPDGMIPTPSGGLRAATEGEALKAGVRNRLAKSRTENRLEDVRGGQGVVAPLESLSRSLGIASRHAAFSSYREHALTAFSNSYGKHMSIPPRKGITPIEVISSSVSKEAQAKLSTVELATLNAHKQQILHTLRTDTPVARAWASATDSIADKLFEKGFVGRADKIAGLRTKNPVSMWKNIAFQSRLGLFSLPQFILQASMAPSIAAMSPKHGVGAMLDVLPVKMALRANDPDMIKFLATKMNKARVWSSQEADEFVEFITVYKSLGISDFGASLPELAGAVDNGIAQSWFSDFLDKGQVFFRAGEEIPRITAAGIAARRIRAKGIKLSSDEGKSEMITEVNRLTLGITGADVQIGMRGVASVPTQFWSFPMRMITALFGKQLTASEKAGLYGSFALLWGAGGVPMGDAMVDYYQTKWGAELTQEEAKLYYNGIVDTAIYHATDGEINSDLSSRMLGNFIPSMVEAFTENPTSTFLAGPAGSSIVNGIEVFSREVAPIVAAGTGTLDQVSDAALAALATNITSVDRAFRGWMAYETGVLRDRKGRSNFKMSTAELLAWAGGIPLQEMTDVYTQADHTRSLVSDPSKKLALEMFNLQRRMYNDPTNKETYFSQIVALRQIAISNGIIDVTLREFTKLQKDRPFIEARLQRYDKDRLIGRNVPRTASSQ